MRARAWFGCLAVAVALLGILLAVALGPGARPAHAALPCGLLNPCTTTTTAAPIPTVTTFTTPTTTPSTMTTTTVAPVKQPLVFPGKTYDGRSRNFSDAVTVAVAKRGKALRGWFVDFVQGSCSDGGHYGSDDFERRSVPISARGTAEETVSLKPGHAFWFTKQDKRVSGAERYVARFTFAGKTVTGTLTDRFSSAELTCHSGAVHFTAHLDGTSQAPVRTNEVATGVYRAKGETVAVYDPWKAVTELKARYTVTCPQVKAQHSTLTLFDLPLSFAGSQAAGNFGDGLHYSSRLAHGITAKETIDVNGQVMADLGRTRESYVADVTIVGFIDYYAANGTQINFSCGIEGGHPATGPKDLPVTDAYG